MRHRAKDTYQLVSLFGDLVVSGHRRDHAFLCKEVSCAYRDDIHDNATAPIKNLRERLEQKNKSIRILNLV